MIHKLTGNVALESAEKHAIPTGAKGRTIAALIRADCIEGEASMPGLRKVMEEHAQIVEAVSEGLSEKD